MPTYALTGSPTVIDDAASITASIQNTGTVPATAFPLGRPIPVGQTVVVPLWRDVRTTVQTAGQAGAVSVTLTAGSPAAGPGPGPVTFDAGAAGSMSVAVSAGSWYSDEGLKTAVSSPFTVAGTRTLYPSAPVSLTATMTVGSAVQTRGLRVVDGATELVRWDAATAADGQLTNQTAEAATANAAGSGTFGPLARTNASATQDEAWLARSTYPLTVPTFDGDASVVHCDVVKLDSAFGPNGHRYWMAFTPYPGADREQPSVVSSADGTTWQVPTGGTNPIVPQSEITAATYLYGSDPDIVLLPDGVTLAVYYRLYWDTPSPSAKQRIYRKTTTNGTTWSAAVTCLDIPAGSGFADTALSPTIAYTSPTSWRMWTVNRQNANPNRVEYRTSTDGIAWSAPSNCTIPTGMDPWHIDVQIVDGVYYMLVSTLDQGTASRLIVLRSTDGITWVSARTGESSVPANERSVPLSGRETVDVAHYRSSFVSNGDGTWDVFVSCRPTNERNTSSDFSNNAWRFSRAKGVTLPMARRSRPQASTNYTRGQPTLLVPPVCMMGAAASPGLWPTTNGAIFQKLPTLADYAAFRYFLLKLDQTGGQMQCGVVRYTKALNWVKVADSGNFATPAAGDLAIDLGAFEMEPGSQYAMYLWFNNNNQTMVRLANIGWLAGQRMVEALTTATMQIQGGANSGYSNNYIQGMALAADV